MIARTTAGATLVLRADVAFGAIEEYFTRAGWARVGGVVTSPILPSEPELAQWRLTTDDTMATYTFNPAVRLRVLEVQGQHAAAQSGQLEQALPVMRETDVAHALQAQDSRTILRGILAASALKAVALAGPIGLLAGHRDPSVADAAARVHLALLHRSAITLARAHDRTQELALVLAAIAGNALPLLSALPDVMPDEMLGLQPTDEDCEAVLVPEVAGAVFEAYERLWETPPRVSPGPHRRTVRVHACPAALFASPNPFADAFPMGYRDVAPVLRPDYVWIAWRYCEPGSTSGLAFDGLVHARDHWIWMPKVFDVILRSRA